MNLIEITKPDFVFEDGRGRLTQLAREGFTQVNAVTSAAGAVRGGHYHKLNRETFYIISGHVKVRAELDGRSEEHSFTAGDMFTVPPMVSHSFEFLSETALVALYDRGVEMDGGGKDIFSIDN